MSFIPGSRADDTLRGTDGTDLILGRHGDDFLLGREGSDILFGGAGHDFIAGDNYPPPMEPYDPSNYGPSQGSTPGPGNNLIFGGAGNDTVVAGYGADTVFGGAGDDSILGFGSIPVHDFELVDDGRNLLSGGAGNDFIRGGANDDTLEGGAGRDTLQGSTGVDTLVGGAGHDIFLFGYLANYGGLRDTAVGPGERDVISDFRHGQDLIDISGYHNHHPPPSGQPAGLFLGMGDFVASHAMQARYEFQDGNTVIQISAPNGFRTDNDPPEKPTEHYVEIELTGIHHLTASDFILPDSIGPF
ncbi:calcium-binding protein [Belnapia sp. F-4-1]|uniref:calcium-binding protein n=1 Tax=Belnapia sp. F-4-1 TaxID=1545443 RepID=UPI00068E5EA8|nr:calcium-binding protein [Belnapia sp. F-4-1]